MKSQSKFFKVNVIAIAIAILGVLFAMHGAADPAAGISALLLANGAGAVEYGQLKAAMEKALNAISGKVDSVDSFLAEIKERVREVEQRQAHRGVLGTFAGGDPGLEIADEVIRSPAIEAFKKGMSPKVEMQISRKLLNAAITSNPGEQNQPLVAPDRSRGPVALVQRRLTIRQLFEQVPTNGNLIEFPRETSFTNNAGVQGAGSSPSGEYEGQTKGESALAFELANVRVPTIAHWIPASRQILDDAPLLGRYVNGRLTYGLKLNEEDQFLNGDGSAGNVNGLINQATAFNGGATNQTALDTLAKAAAQLAASDYLISGYVLNPSDWMDILLLKDTEGRYIFGNPAAMIEPRLWGVPVVATNTMSAGSFLALDAPSAGYVADREDVIIRVSDSHGDFFVRNLVAILCEERSTIVVERPTAIITGALSYAG